MKNPKIVLWVVVALAIVGVGFLLMRPAGGGSGGGQGVVNVDAAKLQDLIAEGVRVIDVRTPGEFEAAHIPGAENVPVETVASASASWDKTEPVAVYCATGSRSVGVVQQLEQAGFETIYHLNEGIVTWTGEVATGSAAAGATTGGATTGKPTATPVMYEFYTDW